MAHKIQIMGRLTRDPSMKYLGSGTEVVDLGIAANQRKKVGDQWVDEAVFFRVTVFGKRAIPVNDYLHKGDPVEVWGRLRPDETGNPRIWDASDGTPKSSYEVIADEVIFVPRVTRKEDDTESEEDDASAPWDEDEI